MANDEKMFIAPERVVERGRGCWSCIWWNNTEDAKHSYALRPDLGNQPFRIGDDLSIKEFQVLVQQGFSEREAVLQLQERAKLQTRPKIFDSMIQKGEIGLCRGKGVDRNDNPVDFTHAGYLCHKWSGREGSSVATSAKPLDKLPDELLDDLETEAKKRGR